MQTKKLIGIALAAALVSTMVVTASTTAFAGRDEIPSNELTDYTSKHTFGIVGAFTNWGSDKDVAMTDADGDGVFVGVVNNLAAGEYEFKVRADNDPDWNDSWGEYEANYERTMNSQTNCKIKAETNVDLVVAIDTNGAEATVWPVAYFTVANEGGDPAAEGKFKSLGVIGKFNDWSADVDMTNNGGVYSAAIGKLDAGSEFKIRADKSWEGTLSWGDYEEEYERTQNSQQNVKVPEDAKNVNVFLGTNGKDLEVWPLVYMYTDAEGKLKVVDTSIPEKAEEQSQASEESQAQVSQTSEESQTSIVEISDIQVSEVSEIAVVDPTGGEPTSELVRSVEDIKNHTMGIVGSFNEWSTEGEVPMTDEDGDGIWEGTIDIENVTPEMIVEHTTDDGNGNQVPTGLKGITFKVRLDGEWSNSWGLYEAPYVRTNNSQTNCIVEAEEGTHVKINVKLDTTRNAPEAIEAGEIDPDEEVDYLLIPVTYTAVTVDAQGNETPIEIKTPVAQTSESSEPSTAPIPSENSKPSETSEKTPAGTTSTVSTVSNAGTASTPAGTTSKTTSTTTTTSTTSTTSTVEAPATGDAAMAAAFIAVAAAALGAVVFASKKKRV